MTDTDAAANAVETNAARRTWDNAKNLKFRFIDAPGNPDFRRPFSSNLPPILLHSRPDCKGRCLDLRENEK
jgi:hypothetical protein